MISEFCYAQVLLSVGVCFFFFVVCFFCRLDFESIYVYYLEVTTW